MKRITTQSTKAKGRRHQQKTRDKLLAAFPELEADDIRSCPMGSQGADLMMSPRAKTIVGLSVECKARAKGFTPVYEALKQADRDDGLTPVAIIRQDRREEIVALRLSDFLRILTSRP